MINNIKIISWIIRSTKNECRFLGKRNEFNRQRKRKDPDAWKKARDNWISAVNDLNATIEASIENARAKMENAIDETFDKFNDEITNGKGLDYLQQQWDLVNDNADDYP